MKIKFCGAAREVTGSAHLITLQNQFSFLLDCGLFQGEEDAELLNNNWGFNPQNINCLILSHAHIDHCGRIPKLFKDGFRGFIYCTPATRDLAALLLLDSAKIQESDAEYENKRIAQTKGKQSNKKVTPLYTIKDVTLCLQSFITIPYEINFKINDSLSFMFRDAGHILGSASVTLSIKEGTEHISLGFTGDIGRPNRPILRDPIPLPNVDYLICESTYGDREHLGNPNELDKLLSIVKNTCVENKGKLIIPAFSVGRTQEIVYMLDQLASKSLLPNIPVYVDSPLAVDATDVFLEHPECYDEDILEYMVTDQNPFGFRNLKLIKKVDESKSLNFTNEPCIIISASGMGNAGRVKHHIFNSVENPKNTILIVGYCSPETPGGKLKNGNKSIFLFGEEKMVRANIEVMDSFSAHADKNEMVSFISNQKTTLKKLMLVHGDYETQLSFKTFLESLGFTNILIPALQDTIEL